MGIAPLPVPDRARNAGLEGRGPQTSPTPSVRQKRFVAYGGNEVQAPTKPTKRQGPCGSQNAMPPRRRPEPSPPTSRAWVKFAGLGPQAPRSWLCRGRVVERSLIESALAGTVRISVASRSAATKCRRRQSQQSARDLAVQGDGG